MYGIDNSEPRGFLDQITTRQTPPEQAESLGQVSRSELKKRQAQALKELIAQDIDATHNDEESVQDAHTPRRQSWLGRALASASSLISSKSQEQSDIEQGEDEFEGVDDDFSTLFDPSTNEQNTSRHEAEQEGHEEANILPQNIGELLDDDVSEAEPDAILAQLIEHDNTDELTDESDITDVDGSDDGVEALLEETDSLEEGIVDTDNIDESNTDEYLDEPAQSSEQPMSMRDFLEDISNSEEENESLIEGKKPTHVPPFIALGVSLIVLSTVGLGGAYAYARHETTRCESVTYEYRTELRNYEKTRMQARKLSMSLNAGQVDKPKVLTSLKKAAATRIPAISSVQCESGVFSFTRNRATAAEVSNVSYTLVSRRTRLTSLMRQTRQSKTRKEYKNALQALQATVDSAQALYDTSTGQVADENTRAQLNTQIEQTRKTVKSKTASAGHLDKQRQALTDAMSHVSDSMTAKAQADQAAAAQAQAQAQAQQATPRQAQPYIPPRTAPRSPTPRGSNGGSSHGWSVPAEPGEANLPDHL
ncbi:hypothetical protein ACFQY8_07680 [Alloscardovia venturai]|uniref:Uncharacterized protein n=1 Tax=Alloscardovia venturai TaxID=1769421 RepID=A0ABW2Y690_9BIFI